MPDWLYPDGGSEVAMVAAEKSFFRDRVWQPEFIAAWTHVVDRYKDNQTVVAIDVLNEPYDLLFNGYPGTGNLRPRHLKLAGFYERVARAIHEVNDQLLILFQDRKVPRLKRWAVTRKPKVRRSVFTYHFYASRWIPGGRRALERAYRRAVGWNQPMWVGEFTCFSRCVNLEPYPNWARKTRKMLAFSKKRRISWAVWLYGQGNFQRPDDVRTPKPQLLEAIRSGF